MGAGMPTLNQQATWGEEMQHQTMFHGNSQVEQFILDEGVDENAASGLRELPWQLQQQVMNRGTLAGNNPSAMLIGRVRDAKQSAGMPTLNQVSKFSNLTPLTRTLPAVRTLTRVTKMSTSGGWGDVEQFIRDEAVDETAANG